MTEPGLHWFARSACSMLGVFLISGCLGDGGPSAQSSSPEGRLTVAALSPGKAGTKTEEKTWAAKPQPAPEKNYPSPSRLSGMRQDQVIGLLGEPGFKRNDDPAQIWQYRTQACALDVFLYRTGDGTVYRVDHFEARNRGNNQVSEKDCFVGLLKAHEQKRAG
ncbi:MAG: hypothetical protein ISR51_07080 [Rhodospirillales bacterium]|nr:hypothetical protein [Alphaproteobacteria bacterium]MBL6948424.1 hypothetical protein [Rhodospirillales bacterium]